MRSVARGPVLPARPTSQRAPLSRALPPARVLRDAAPSALRSTASAGRDGGAQPLPLPDAHREPALRADASLDGALSRAVFIVSVAPARHDGAQPRLLRGAPRGLALHPCAPLGGGLSFMPLYADRRRFSSLGNAGSDAAPAEVASPASAPSCALPTSSTEPRVRPEIKKLPFVDRDPEALTIAFHNIRNVHMAHDRTALWKPTLVTAGQLYGAGKTLMGENAVAWLKQNQVLRQQLLRQLRPSINPAGAKSLSGMSQDTAERLVDDYINAETVSIDLSLSGMFLPEISRENPPQGFILSTWRQERLLVHMLHERMGACAGIKDKTAWAARTSLSLTELVGAFREATGRNVFIHIDEIGKLVTDGFAPLFTPVATDTLHVAHLRRFYEFWETITPLLYHKHSYLFLSGKQAAFPLLGLRAYHAINIVSPTAHHALVLGALSTEDIRQIFVTATLEGGLPLQHFVRIDPNLLPELCKRIVHATAGLPRLVHYCLQALCRLAPQPVAPSAAAADTSPTSSSALILRSVADIDAALLRARDECWADSMVSRVLALDALPPGVEDAYYDLLVAALIGEPLRADELYELANGNALLLVELVDKLALYTVRTRVDGAEVVHVRYPAWTAQYVRQRSSIRNDPRVKALLPLWDEVPVKMIDGGMPLEWAVQVRLAYLLEHYVRVLRTRATWGDVFPVLRGSLLADQRLELVAEPELIERLLPRVVEETMRTRAPDYSTLLQRPGSAAVTPADWAWLLANMFPPGTVAYFASHSHGPDLAVRCSATTVLAVQCKLYDPKSSELSAQGVQEEVDKTAPVMGVVSSGARNAVMRQADKADQRNKDSRHLHAMRELYFTARRHLNDDSNLRDVKPSGGGTSDDDTVWYKLRPTACEQICLVVVAWALSAGIMAKLGDREALLLGPGQHDLGGRQPVSVPKGMQVVLLSHRGIKSLLGEAYELLDELVRRRREPDEAKSPFPPKPLRRLFATRDVVTRPLPPFELESFLRDEAKIDEDGVKDYLPLLKKNKVDEAGLRVLATEPKRDIEARLEKWGVSADNDRLQLANAIVTRFGAREM